MREPESWRWWCVGEHVPLPATQSSGPYGGSEGLCAVTLLPGRSHRLTGEPPITEERAGTRLPGSKAPVFPPPNSEGGCSITGVLGRAEFPPVARELPLVLVSPCGTHIRPRARSASRCPYLLSGQGDKPARWGPEEPLEKPSCWKVSLERRCWNTGQAPGCRSL